MSPSTTSSLAATRDQVLAELRDGERFLLVTHENPDGDALGSLVAMRGLLDALGKDALSLLPSSDLPLPYEYRFFDLGHAIAEVPDDLAQRLVVYLDCGNADRSPIDPGDARVLNIDHHHDNTRFGTINHVVDDASCTAELVWDLMAGLGVRPTPAVAEALYVGLVTDTGRFMYESTGRTAHLMAVDLLDQGVDVEATYRRLYEGMPVAKLALLARALNRLSRYDGGRLTLAIVRAEDFAETGAEESYTEGIIDHLRSVAGTMVAAMVRERGANRKVSLRATGNEVDVSAIARAGGGGGHRRAAGFATELPDDQLVVFLREQIAVQLD